VRVEPREGGGRRPHRVKRPITDNAGLIVSLTATMGLALTLAFNASGQLDPAYQNRSLHVAKETAAALVLLLVAALLLGRFRRTGRVLDLLALAGVVLLAGKTLVFSVLAAILAETSGGLTTWRTTGAAMLGALLLAASPLAPDRVVRDRRSGPARCRHRGDSAVPRRRSPLRAPGRAGGG
jgi:hypothetical protein